MEDFSDCGALLEGCMDSYANVCMFVFKGFVGTVKILLFFQKYEREISRVQT